MTHALIDSLWMKNLTEGKRERAKEKKRRKKREPPDLETREKEKGRGFQSFNK